MALTVVVFNATDVASFHVIRRQAAQRHDLDTVWDMVYRKETTMHDDHPNYTDVLNMLDVCGETEGPGLIPATDWAVFLRPRPRDDWP